MLLSMQSGAVSDPIANRTAAGIAPAADRSIAETASPWRLYRQSAQFEMSYRDTKSAGQTVLEIQVQFVFKGRLSAFFQVLRDTEHAEQWLDSVDSVRIIASPSPFEDWVHTTFDTPWPLQKRDMVTCSTWLQQIDYSIGMSVFSCNDKSPPLPGTVRIEQLQAHWMLRSLPDHQVQVLYTGTADAGGRLPRWLSDPVALTSSLRSFRALQRQLSLPVYQQALSEVCEPEYSAAGLSLPADVNTPACQKLVLRIKQ
jgi:hypothetical protein